MPRKKETITLSIPPGTKEQLEAIARRLNITWGKEPSISGLIVAIAQQQLEVGQRFNLAKVQVQALEQAIKLLIDSGYIPEAKTLSALMLERADIAPPLRQSVLERMSMSHSGEAWKVLIEQQIETRQPFRLYYQDAQKKTWEFTVRHAQINFREKRFYLEIWSEETQGNFDVPELAHNRSLRLDRITNLTLLPIEGMWREDLDCVKVQLHFFKGLVRAYESKPQDVSNDLDGDVRKVVRKVSNTFWLEREVLAYGQDCVVILPENVRDRLKQKLLTLCQLYDIETRS
ncbi:MAG: WYL domain-containing protein [Nostoc sp.]|uniref:helix-turn-helix transcriptional regulator n=1 Tax=Nostoc sp. TaxID=1180 RepID=UPI002FFCF950